MKRITKDEIITLDNDSEYFVVEIVEQGDIHYLYLVNESDEDVILVEETVKDGELVIETVNDSNKITEVMEIIAERLIEN